MTSEAAQVQVATCHSYDERAIASLLPDLPFLQVRPGDKVVLKPNWVFQSHRYKSEEWEHVITHPAVLGAVLDKVLARLDGRGRISILDGPMTDASFAALIARYPVHEWRERAGRAGVALEVVDLRDHEWTLKDGVIVDRKELPGDPRGKVVVDLAGDASEFYGHVRSKRGYYGADYDLAETNAAHDGTRNLYSVSRTVVEADVFINLPKLKTHRKAGITCCLKNLVGINTYKNYLPHHSEGGPGEGGDQFPADTVKARLEGPLITFVKQHVLRIPLVAAALAPLKKVALGVFGDSSSTVRSGSWYGNDTLWRTIVDLNKVLFYCRENGEMGLGAKRFIGVVDAIVGGEGDGPLAPDPVRMGYLVCGVNPVAIDAACATLMGFDPLAIRSVARAFAARRFPLCDFALSDVVLRFGHDAWRIDDLPRERVVPFRAQFAWRGHVEKEPAPRQSLGRGATPIEGDAVAPEVTFVIPCYNERDYVARCIASIAAQTAQPGRFEILVVDNGSLDDTREVAAGLGATVLANPRRGASASRNLGAAAARAPLVAFVDADCLLPPDWVATLTCDLAEAGGVAAAAPAVPAADGMTWVERGWAAVFVSFARRSEKGVARVSNLASSNMLVRKDIFSEAGGFDELLLSCEDYDLSQRLQRHGPLLFDENVQVLHLRESKTVGELFRREIARGRFSWRCFAKNGWRLRELPSTVIPLVNLSAALALVVAVAAGRAQAALVASLLLAAVPCIFLVRSRAPVAGVLDSLQQYAVAATYVSARSAALAKELLDLSLEDGGQGAGRLLFRKPRT